MTKLVVQEIFQFLCIHGFALMVAVLALWLVAVVAIYAKHRPSMAGGSQLILLGF